MFRLIRCIGSISQMSALIYKYIQCSELSFDAIIFIRKKTNIMFKKDILLMLQQSSVIPSVDI